MDATDSPTVQLKLSEKLRAPPVDIEFKNLNYTLPGRDQKQLLHSLSGKFATGQITAILGASGAGKTMLLNVLAGQIFKGATGAITVNGEPRQMRTFQNLYAFITQEDLLQPKLTLRESITAATDLKVGNFLSQPEKTNMINGILETLGLQNCLSTRVEHLSGGERKRLSLALEMVSNPSVIFLDEPTSGLDIVSIKQCMGVLRSLKQNGRTVICTIHQPSSSTFSEFDQNFSVHKFITLLRSIFDNIYPNADALIRVIGHFKKKIYPNEQIVLLYLLPIVNQWLQMHENLAVHQERVYFLANGCCVYNGSTTDILPFLKSINLECPITYSSAEFIIECVQLNEELIPAMEAAVKDKNSISCTEIQNFKSDKSKERYDNPALMISFWVQFYILLKRMMVQTRRSKSSIVLQILHNSFLGLAVGLIFFNIGNSAAMILSNLKMFLCVVLFYVYVPLTAQVVLCAYILVPLEIPLVKKEYTNHWYAFEPYFLALTFRNLPIMIATCLTFVIITYLMTGQPLEITRFVMFTGVSIFVGMVSESAGIAIGSLMKVQTGLFAAIALVYAPGGLLCIYGIGWIKDISPVMKFVMNTNFIRCSAILLSQVAFTNRDPLDCDKDFCYYTNPEVPLKDFGLDDFSMGMNMVVLLITYSLFKLIAFLALKFRLSPEYAYKMQYLKNKFMFSQLKK